MKLQHLFSINFPIALFFGLSCSIFPVFVLRMYGLPSDEGAIWVTRLTGGSILGFSTLMWFGRNTTSIEARMAVALALIVQDAVGFLASTVIQMTGNINAFGWSNPVLYGALATAYAYFRIVRPQDC